MRILAIHAGHDSNACVYEEGKLEKYFSTSCLLEQPFVKDPDHVIRDLLSSLGNEIGAEIGVERFIRFQVGEDS